MQFDLMTLEPLLRYKLLYSTITPRPIAWVSTLNADGQLNAAPFSSFNVFGEDPPTLVFSINNRTDTDRKDTGVNIRERQEFVVNLVSEDNLEQMNISAIEFPPDVDEFVEAGLTPAPSAHIKTPRIAESHVSFECTLNQIIALGPKRSLVLGNVIAMHIDDDAVIDVGRAYIDTPRLRLIGRMHASSYVRTSDIFEMPVTPLAKWNQKSTR